MVITIRDLLHILRRHAHDHLEDVEDRHHSLHAVEAVHRHQSVATIEEGLTHGLCLGHCRGTGVEGVMVEREDIEDLLPVTLKLIKETDALISSRTVPLVMTVG